MARNPLSYTNRSFTSIYNELKALWPNKPDWFLRIIAGSNDVAHWYLDARAQNLTLSSAYTREAIYDLAAYLDYYPSGRSSASAACTVTVDAGAVPITIPKEELVINVDDGTGTTFTFEALEDLTISTGTTGTAIFYSGTTVSDLTIGASDGTSALQEFVIPDPQALEESVSVTIDSVLWTEQTTLVNSTGSDKHYRLIRKPDGYLAIRTGDGTYGAIPPVGDVQVSYRKGGGASANIPQTSATVSYTGGNADVVSVAADEDFSGGSDGETLERTRFLAPKMLKRKERAITQDDYIYMSLGYSASVIQAQCFPGLYGEATVGVHIVPAGGGNPSAGLKLGLQEYLKDRSVLGLTDVRVRDPIYQAEDIDIDIKVRPGETYSATKPFAEVAARLLVSEITAELLEIYESDGIAAATTFINDTWGYSFTSTAYNKLTDILDRRSRDGFNSWGDGLRVNDIISAVDSLPQVDYVTLNTPASDVSLDYTEILTEGTITIGEIT